MSITHTELSPESRLSANLQIAISHVEAAIWAMRSMTTDNAPPDGITDLDWLQQVAELLSELDRQTRSPHCPKCGGSQLIYCEEVNMHYRLTNADATSWRFGGDGDPQETGHWRIECSTCGHELRTASEARGFDNINVICDDVAM